MAAAAVAREGCAPSRGDDAGKQRGEAIGGNDAGDMGGSNMRRQSDWGKYQDEVSGSKAIGGSKRRKQEENAVGGSQQRL